MKQIALLLTILVGVITFTNAKAKGNGENDLAICAAAEIIAGIDDTGYRVMNFEYYKEITKTRNEALTASSFYIGKSHSYIEVLAKEKGLSAKRFGTLIYKECVKKGVSFL